MAQSPLTSRKRSKNLTNKEWTRLFQLLLKDFDGKKLKQGAIKKHANSFSVSTKTVSKFWKQGSSYLAEGLPADVSNKRKNRVGRKRIELDIEKVKSVEYRRHKTLQGLANVLGMSKTTVYRRYKEGHLHRHSNAIQPGLTEEHKRERLRFCVSMFEERSFLNGVRLELRFIDMFDHVVIDEKWFFLTKASEHYYLTLDETEPYRSCQSKNFITKVMFLVAVARPRFDSSGECIFDGKIRVFPFTTREGAKRGSKNRPAGTLETKPILSITKEETSHWMINKVLPAIKEKWHASSRSLPIYIQQVNCKAHLNPLDPEFVEASRLGGFDIRLKCQPAKSPDLNMLDLGYFRAIESLQHKEAPKGVDELVGAVEKSFRELSPKCLNKVFITLQQVMSEILKIKGGNQYKLPHMQKDKLERDGRIPLTLSCDFEVVEQVTSASKLAETWIARRFEDVQI